MLRTVLKWVLIGGAILFVAGNPHQAANLVSKLFAKGADIVAGFATFVSSINF